MPKSEEVLAALSRALAQEPPGRLPSVREWSVRLGVGTGVVRGALDRMIASGILRKRAGAGFWRISEFPEQKPSHRRPGASRLAASLGAELRAGAHPWNRPLPSIKEWALRWGCHRQTAASVLEALRDEGLLERRGRSYQPVSPRRGGAGAPGLVLCVGAAGPSGDLRMDTEREMDFWKDLGVEASRLGLALRRVPWNGGVLRPETSVVGVVASTWHLPDPPRLYAALDRLRLPVCVWIQDPSAHRNPARAHPRIRFHDQGYGSESGRQIAAHLVGSGHRRIAFVSPWHGSQWSRDRLEGLEDEALSRGVPVDAFCLDGVSEWDRLAPAWADPAVWETFPADLVGRVVEGAPDSMREHAIRTLAWNRIRRDAAPLFEAAAVSGATAWVGANDACALLARDWLAARGERRVLAGFDDTSEALRAGITSFRFDSSAMARSMLGQILTSAAGPGLSRHGGVVVPRGG